MLSFFRRILNSRTGIIVTFIVLGMIALAFAAGDVTGLRSAGIGHLGGNAAVATVAGQEVTPAELKQRVQADLDGFKQRDPSLDMARFIEAGGFEGTLERLIDNLAIEKFGGEQGIVVSKKWIDGQIASIPSLQGPDGKFSQTAYDRILAERKITDAQVRGDIARSAISRYLITPTLGATQVPNQIALPYASLLLEKRAGQIGFVPTRAMGAGAQPTEAELTDFYKRNATRYKVPERRVISYAVITPDQVKAAAAATDAEIAAAYKERAASYAATEKRSLQQVVIGDRAAADAFVAKVKAGASMSDAAKAIGLEANKIEGAEKTPYTSQTSPEIAAAVFGAAKGAVVGPLKSPLGWTIVRVDAIEQVAAKSLAQATPELAKAIAADKQARLLADLHDQMDDAIADHATFAEVVKDNKLQTVTTPPLFADGSNPATPGAKPDPALAQVVRAAFLAEQGDDPQLAPVGQDGSFAVVTLGQVIRAAPPPMAEIKEAVIRDFSIDRARKAARVVASGILAKVNKGVPLKDALAQANVKLPAPQPLGASRAQLAAAQKGAPAPLVLLFSMVQGTAKMLEAPQQGGWFIVKLDTIERHDARGKQQIIDAMRADLGKVVGREYIEQFNDAVRRAVGVKKNDALIAQTRKELADRATPQP